MRLDVDAARALLTTHHHGIFGTIHPERGVDLVPVVYAIVDGHVGIPIDTVKPKSSTRLQREDNLRRDPRATLLVEHWDADDWTRLWWVRATLTYQTDPPSDLTDLLADALTGSVVQYADRPFHHLLVACVDEITGWSAAELPPTSR